MTGFSSPDSKYLRPAADHSHINIVKIALVVTFVLAGLCGGFMSGTAQAQTTYDTPSKQPVPRWATLKFNETNARSGPSRDNKILWTYRQKGLPVQIITETKEWRMICDPDGGIAWVSKSLLSPRRSVIITGTQSQALRTKPESDARIKSHVRPRAIALLDKCRDGHCRVAIGRESGWLEERNLWGTQTGAVCKRPDILTRLGAKRS
ncbi:MAG: SH3 domain-containing protein [Asticcacaulis sp.]